MQQRQLDAALTDDLVLPLQTKAALPGFDLGNKEGY